MSSIIKKAYAKVNLHLDVVDRYIDGYHEVHTVMQSVSLCDDIEILLEGNKIDITCDEPGVPIDSTNIVWRAAKLFLSEIGRSEQGLKINITKRIPVSAGLGGGSADAAALLCGLNELCGQPLGRERLLAIGASIGADVPFCMVGGTAFADGRGDVLHEWSPLPECYFVIARGGEGVSTPWAYGALDQSFNGFCEGSYLPHNASCIEDSIKKNDIVGVSKGLYNIFEAVVFDERPIAKELKDLLINEGALGALMSGSGTAVFGVFDDKTRAEEAVEKIKGIGYFSAIATPIKRYF